MLRRQISKVLQATTRKNLRMKMPDGYNVSLVNEEGTQMPKSSGENQLLGLASRPRWSSSPASDRMPTTTACSAEPSRRWCWTRRSADLDEGYKQTTASTA